MKLVLVELEKLRTVRGTWLLLAFAVLSPLPLTIVMLTQTDALERAPQDAMGLLLITATLAAALGATACAREFEQRTITTSFTLEPRRERVIGAKAAAIALVGGAAAALASAFVLSITAIWLSSSGEPWPWTAGETAQTLVGAVAIVSALAVAGTGFGGMTRHVGAAVTLLLIVYFVVEGLLVDRFGVWRDFGPTAAGSALIEPLNDHALGYLGALVVVWGFALAYLLAGIAIVRRADV